MYFVRLLLNVYPEYGTGTGTGICNEALDYKISWLNWLNYVLQD